MTNRILPPIDYLRQRLRYEPETGKLFWLWHPEKRGSFNSRFAGEEAFTASDGRGYRVGLIDGQTHRAHRVVWALYFGRPPEGQIDHINGDRSDNRIENLREVTALENSRNRAIQNNNSSNHSGVHWSNRYHKWIARISIKGERKHLGVFDSLEAALAARRQAEIELGFHANHGRKQDSG